MTQPSKRPEYQDGAGPITTADPTTEVAIALAQEGLGAVEPCTVMQRLDAAAAKHGPKTAFRFERPLGTWQTTTWDEMRQNVRSAAKALMHLGLERFGTVSILGFNAPEWHTALLGAIYAGGKGAGIYTTNSPDACAHIINHSKSMAVFVDGLEQMQKIASIAERLDTVRVIVCWDPEVDVDKEAPSVDGVQFLSWNAFIDNAVHVEDAQLDERIAAQKPGHVASLIYTSGTTGLPKAVMISHDNLTWTAQALLSVGPDFGRVSGVTEHLVSYLPLSHVAAQILDVFVPITTAATCLENCILYFARPDALRGSLPITLREAKPTLFFGVPRVWEKMEEKMREQGKTNKGMKKALITWAKGVGRATWQRKSVGGVGGNAWGYTVAKALIFNKVREKLNFDQTRYFATSAAPIAVETLQFFADLDIPIQEAFGMSECCGPHTSTHQQKWFLMGSVGIPLEGTEVRLEHVEGRDNPGDGEMLIRGRHVMSGYMYDQEKTDENITPDGWLRSGDLARRDDTGMCFIVSRLKELLVTSGGENVAPAPIEQRIVRECPGVSNVVLIGDKKKFLSILVTCLVELDPETNLPTSRLTGAALEVDLACKTVDEAQKSEVWKKHIQGGVDRYNKDAHSRAQRVQKFQLLGTDFTVADGSLTSSLKLKRRVVTERFAAEIRTLYE